MLTGNLGDKLIPQNEILRDVSDLKALANLHESMEWLACRLKTFFANLPHASSKYKAVTSLDDKNNVIDGLYAETLNIDICSRCCVYNQYKDTNAYICCCLFCLIRKKMEYCL